MAPPPNRAAYVETPRAKQVVRDAPFPVPREHEVIIKVHSVALNPVDVVMQAQGLLVPEDGYPFIGGCDIAGTIYSIGSDVTKFSPGDRVVASTDGFSTGYSTNWGFQNFCATNELVAAKIPDNLSFNEATVLPMGINTSGVGLYDKDTLALELPVAAKDVRPNGKVVLIWGGSSSMGTIAIMMARASGYEVAVTAGAKNHDYVKDLGASYVFDYKKDGVENEIIEALKDKNFAGAYVAVLDHETIRTAVTIASKLGPDKKMTSVTPPNWPKLEGLPEDVQIGYVVAANVRDNFLGPALWGRWVPTALAEGSLRCKPDPIVVAHGLEGIQAGLDRMSQGASAQKFVVQIV